MAEVLVESENRTPLDGIRVLDLSRLVAGNVVSVVLADFGADVIKVEHPIYGDDLRKWSEDGIETWWKVYGRNKRSLALDLKDAESIGALKKLIAISGVFIENFVPGKLEELGLAPAMLLDINPSLIIVRVSGWGQTGPYSHKPGFGTLVEAMSGFAHLNNGVVTLNLGTNELDFTFVVYLFSVCRWASVHCIAIPETPLASF